MLARQKWQIATIAALEDVFAERLRQETPTGGDLPDGASPAAQTLADQITQANDDDTLSAEDLISLAAVCVSEAEVLREESS